MKLLKNYKTSIPALFIIVSIVLMYAGVIDKDQMSAGIAAFTAMGLLGAKDFTTKDNDVK